MGDTDVLGIVSIVFAFLFAPVGLVLGIIGIVKNRKSGRSITLPLIGLIISVLALPVFFFVVGIGFMAYSGTLNPEGFIPEQCTFSAGFACADASYDSNSETIELVVANRLGRSIEAGSVSVTSNDVNGACETSGTVIIPNGASERFILSDCTKRGEPTAIRGDVMLNYRYEGDGAPRVGHGEIYVRI